MLAYTAVRLPASGADGRRYQLFDSAGHLLLVADQGSPWLPDDPTHHVRFARPDGTAVASLDLPWLNAETPEAKRSFAIVYDDAVYALVSRSKRANADEDRLAVWLLEVEGQAWLMVQETLDSVPRISLFDEVPGDLAIYGSPQDAGLPDPIGVVSASGEEDGRFAITFPAGELEQAPLMALALTFLLDEQSE